MPTETPTPSTPDPPGANSKQSHFATASARTTAITSSKPQSEFIRERPPLSKQQALAALTNGELEIVGRMPWSSNATFLVDVLPTETTTEAIPIQAVYKPVRGERPLWDFPEGLHVRERACFLLSETLGWHLVPPTVVRDGPFGQGSLQLFVLADFSEHYLTLRSDPQHTLDLMRLCAFDVLANSTDRKSGHVLFGETETLGNSKIFAVDNGLSFHTEFKLRTVLWDFTGQPLPEEITNPISDLLSQDDLKCLEGLLTESEILATQKRAEILLQSGIFPVDPTGHRWPWPLV